MKAPKSCKVCGNPCPVYVYPNGGYYYRVTCSDKCKNFAVAKNRKPGLKYQTKLRLTAKRRAAQQAALAELRAKNANPGSK